MTIQSFSRTILSIVIVLTGYFEPVLAQGSKYDKEPQAVIMANPDVAKTFTKRYPGAYDIKWYKDNSAYFKNNGVTTSAWFARNGDFMYSVSYYGKDQLPKPVLSSIRGNYRKWDIFGVTEVTVSDKTAYFVILENKTRFLKLKYYDGEIDEESIIIKRN